MKKNLAISLLATLTFAGAFSAFASCGNSDSSARMNARDVYAMSAVSGVSYLSDKQDSPAKTVSFLSASAAADITRPSYITDNDLQGMRNCINAFGNIVAGGGISQTVQNNTAADDTLLGAYKFEMKISLPEGSGAFSQYTMYFNELATNVDTEMDDGVEETETSTTFEGVLVHQEEWFVVKGHKELETEGKETEYELEFRTYKNIGTESIQPDESKYVVVSQSFEQNEIEYEYAFYEGGRKIQEIELEYEEEKSGVELSFQIKDLTSGKVQETEYELRQVANGFRIEFEKNGKETYITVEETATGYVFTYANGFSETVE